MVASERGQRRAGCFLAGWILLFLALFWMAGTFCSIYRFCSPYRNRQRRTENRLLVVARESERLYLVTGKWPSSDDDVRALTLSTFPGETKLLDAWHNPITYSPFDVRRGFGFVRSYGKDGMPGGLGECADLIVRYGEDMARTGAVETIPVQTGASK